MPDSVRGFVRGGRTPTPCKEAVMVESPNYLAVSHGYAGTLYNGLEVDGSAAVLALLVCKLIAEATVLKA